MRIERARPSDLPAVEALLSAAGLPLAGAPEAFARGVVMRDGEAVVGVAAVERYGLAGLLRSVVVKPDRRGAGLGRDLVVAAEALARREGIRDLYLLTETAITWFPRLGYSVVPRDEAAAVVGQSIEFTTACAETAVAMRREIADQDLPIPGTARQPGPGP
jgi:amino-acid N-acetyltransferase